jgi:hypothetical protein
MSERTRLHNAVRVGQFIKRLFSAPGTTKYPTAKAPVSFEHLQQMLEYARRRNLCGRSKYRGGDNWIGRSINLVTDKRTFSVRANGPGSNMATIRTQYPSASWSDMQHHLGIYLVDGKLEFRASHDGIGPREEMPLATSAEDLAEIGRCFDYWYEEFGLPESLGHPINPPKQFEPTGNALRDIQTYLEDGSVRAFHELFEDSGRVIWVDWGEEDDNIVRMTADALALDNLTARFDRDSCDLLISYRGTEHRVRYREEGIADRDTSIKALNALLQPDYELRVCKASHGSDTLALMALSETDWARLEQIYPEAYAVHFEMIRQDSVIFDYSD